MSRNYRFFVDLARKRVPPAHDAKVRFLDFGCGEGQIVSLAREVGYAAEGVDTYAGGWGEAMAVGLQLEGVQRIPPGAPLPFDTGRFQIVVSNMVLEHVRDLGPVAAELSRVTATGGLVLLAMPTRSTWWEAHLRVPFAHLLPTGSASQRVALSLAHRFGLGQRQQAREAFVAGAIEALTTEIFVHRHQELVAAFQPTFALEATLEADWARDRIEQHRLTSWLAPIARTKAATPVLRALTRRTALSLLALRRRQAGDQKFS
jgi:SAM-dependent methyltransferase